MSLLSGILGITPSTSSHAPIESFTTAALSRILGNGVKSSSVTASESSSSTQSIGQTTGATSFSSILDNLLPDASQQEDINEEQLFSVLLEERLTTLKGADSANAYHQLLESYKEAMTDESGYVKVEDAARAALGDMVTSGALSVEEAETIHAQAFQAAQIDGNSGALYDSLGTTMAVTMVDLALASSGKIMAQFDSGAIKAGRLSLDYRQENGPAKFVGGEALAATASTTATEFVGGDGFLFKPISESNGNLVILLPAAMAQEVASVTLVDNAGQTLETGDAFATFRDGRPIYHFNKPGSGYPDNLTVIVTMEDGTERKYAIADPSQRYE